MPNSQYEELARGALLEITSDVSIGVLLGEQIESDGTVSVLFASALLGYPGWRWTVSIGHIAGEEPTVLEAELMPSDGALLSPDWVPWSERLAEYEAAQALAEDALESAETESSDSIDDDDDEDLDDDGLDDDIDDDDIDGDFDDDDDIDDDYEIAGVFHSGDRDGVSVDDLDDSLDEEDNVNGGSGDSD